MLAFIWNNIETLCFMLLVTEFTTYVLGLLIPKIEPILLIIRYVVFDIAAALIFAIAIFADNYFLLFLSIAMITAAILLIRISTLLEKVQEENE